MQDHARDPVQHGILSPDHFDHPRCHQTGTLDRDPGVAVLLHDDGGDFLGCDGSYGASNGTATHDDQVRIHCP
jgi:hypothetical protein